MHGALNIIFSACSIRTTKDQERDFVTEFVPGVTEYTIIQYLKKVARFARQRLGGLHGTEGWSNLLTFLQNCNQMDKKAKLRCETLQRLKHPGLQDQSGNLTEQKAAQQVYILSLLYYHTFKLKTDGDTNMFHIRLIPRANQTLSFIDGIALWEKLLLSYRNNDSKPATLETSLLEAITRDNGAEGIAVRDRLASHIKLQGMTKEFEKYKQDTQVYELLLDAAVRELVAEDEASALLTTATTSSRNTNNRRLHVNVNNTSMVNSATANDPSFWLHCSEENNREAQSQMDIVNENRLSNDPNLQINSFPMAPDRITHQGGRGNGQYNSYNHGQGVNYQIRDNGYQGQGTNYRGSLPNNGRGSGGAGRFPAQYTRGRPSENIHTACMACGGTHSWTCCPFKLKGPAQQPTAPVKEEKYRMDPQLLALLDLPRAMEVIQMSINTGNMKYQSEGYKTNIINFVKLEDAKKQRAEKTKSSKPEPAPTIVASVRLAISGSINHVHIPSFGIYNGVYGPRPQQVYSNEVLAYSEAEIRQATTKEIDYRLAINESDLTSERLSRPSRIKSTEPYWTETDPDYYKFPTGTAKCHIDTGATPCVIRKDIAEGLKLLIEETNVQLGVVGVFGDVKYAHHVCWITITFKCQVQITVMAVVVENMSSAILIGQTDFRGNNISYISSENLLIFGNHRNPTHTETLMTIEEIAAYPIKGYQINN